MEVILHKLPNGSMAPTNEEEAEKLKRLRVGAGVRCDVKQMRNYKFHKKWFVLAQYAYEMWKDGAEPVFYKGEEVQPNFERFRKDLTIMAGYFDVEFNVQGELRLAAKSISFANMEEAEFALLFSATLDAILRKILTRPDIDEAKLRKYVDEVMRFD
jgi:hypothetical protein